ncbi:MAG: FkbM family methyltransferase [Flavobacteriaceae bacterium]
MKITVSRIIRKIKNVFGKNPNSFLKEITGVIHIGANIGQERDLYQSNGLAVIWVEPIPKVFKQLEYNLTNYKNQIPLQALVTDVEDKEYVFHIANNNGASSSIFNLKHHKDIWPDINFQESITLTSTTLPTLLKKNSIDQSNYQSLIIDTQGSELLVLKGCLPILNQFKFIKTEVADFEAYEGCCTLDQINHFMNTNGFQEYSKRDFAQRAKGGRYYDIIFKNPLYQD